MLIFLIYYVSYGKSLLLFEKCHWLRTQVLSMLNITDRGRQILGQYSLVNSGKLTETFMKFYWFSTLSIDLLWDKRCGLGLMSSKPVWDLTSWTNCLSNFFLSFTLANELQENWFMMGTGFLEVSPSIKIKAEISVNSEGAPDCYLDRRNFKCTPNYFYGLIECYIKSLKHLFLLHLHRQSETNWDLKFACGLLI